VGFFYSLSRLFGFLCVLLPGKTVVGVLFFFFDGSRIYRFVGVQNANAFGPPFSAGSSFIKLQSSVRPCSLASEPLSSHLPCYSPPLFFWFLQADRMLRWFNTTPERFSPPWGVLLFLWFMWSAAHMDLQLKRFLFFSQGYLSRAPAKHLFFWLGMGD